MKSRLPPTAGALRLQQQRQAKKIIKKAQRKRYYEKKKKKVRALDNRYSTNAHVELPLKNNNALGNG